MVDDNGQLPLAGWAIVQTNGLTLIGKLVTIPKVALDVLGKEVGHTRSVGEQPNALSPVYELKPQMAPTQEGIQIGHLAVPVWLLGLKSVELPIGCLVERLEEFSPRIRRSLAQAVSAAEEMATMLRADESSITLVRPGTRLPPPGGIIR